MRHTYKSICDKIHETYNTGLTLEELNKVLPKLCRTVKTYNFKTSDAKYRLGFEYIKHEPEITASVLRAVHFYPSNVDYIREYFDRLRCLCEPYRIPVDIMATDTFGFVCDDRLTEGEYMELLREISLKLIRIGHDVWAIHELLLDRAKNDPLNFNYFISWVIDDIDMVCELYAKLCNDQEIKPPVISEPIIENGNVESVAILASECHNSDIEITEPYKMPTKVKPDQRILTSLDHTVKNMTELANTGLSTGQLYKSIWRLYHCFAEQVFPEFPTFIKEHKERKVSIISQIQETYEDSERFPQFLEFTETVCMLTHDLQLVDAVEQLLVEISEIDDFDYHKLSEYFVEKIMDMVSRSIRTVVNFTVSDVLEWSKTPINSATAFQGVYHTLYAMALRDCDPDWVRKSTSPYLMDNMDMLEVLNYDDVLRIYQNSFKLMTLANDHDNSFFSHVRIVGMLPRYSTLFEDLTATLPEFILKVAH